MHTEFMIDHCIRDVVILTNIYEKRFLIFNINSLYQIEQFGNCQLAMSKSYRL